MQGNARRKAERSYASRSRVNAIATPSIAAPIALSKKEHLDPVRSVFSVK
jgi:hypothetical protein